MELSRVNELKKVDSLTTTHSTALSFNGPQIASRLAALYGSTCTEVILSKRKPDNVNKRKRNTHKINSQNINKK